MLKALLLEEVRFCYKLRYNYIIFLCITLSPYACLRNILIICCLYFAAVVFGRSPLSGWTNIPTYEKDNTDDVVESNKQLDQKGNLFLDVVETRKKMVILLSL